MKANDEKLLAFDFDFIGIQNYTREIIKHSFFTPFIKASVVKAEKRNVPLTAMNWEIYPEGIYHLLKMYNEYPSIKKIIITENGAAFQKLGLATVNSGGGVPIKLAVQPGSTELITPKTACSGGKVEPLPDGIAESGVDVGDVEGWVPRDPCHFDELARSVEFKVDVR